MNFRNFMFSPSFIRMQNQSSLISRMLGGSSKAGAASFTPQYMSRSTMKAYSKLMANQFNGRDSFTWTEDVSKSEDEGKYSRTAEKLYRTTLTGSYTPTPKATLADVTAAFEDARAANRAKLDHAGNEIVAVNDRAGRELIYASTRINGARYDYQSTQYLSGGAYLDRIDQNAFNRQMVNRQINNILSDHQISVDEDEDYHFTVDAYTNYISVSGSDTVKCHLIENALNHGENGKNLYEHIKLCSLWEKDLNGERDNNIQLFDGGKILRYASELMREKLGINLSEVTRQGDDFVTEDGKSVKGLFTKYVLEHPTSGFTVQAETGLYHGYIDRALSFSDSLKMDLSIRFDSSGLHDIRQKHSYGTGDTTWINDYLHGLANQTGKTVLTTFIDTADEQGFISSSAKSPTENEKPEDVSSSTCGGAVGINAAKLARLLAAAKTQSQVRAVITQIQSDLDECDRGKSKGFDVDESSYAAAQQLLQQAHSRLAQAENRQPTPEEEMASALASIL